MHHPVDSNAVLWLTSWLAGCIQQHHIAVSWRPQSDIVSCIRSSESELFSVSGVYLYCWRLLFDFSLFLCIGSPVGKFGMWYCSWCEWVSRSRLPGQPFSAGCEFSVRYALLAKSLDIYKPRKRRLFAESTWLRVILPSVTERQRVDRCADCQEMRCRVFLTEFVQQMWVQWKWYMIWYIWYDMFVNRNWVNTRWQCSTVPYSTVQYSTVQYSTVQYNTVTNEL